MKPHPVPIRPAIPSDAALIHAFLRPFAEREMLVPRTIEEISLLVRHGFLAEYGGEIVGFAAIEIYSRKLAEVQSLAVHPEYQRRGIGRRLVQRCVERAQEQGVLELMAITTSDKLFQDCGFDYSLPNQKRALFVQTRDHH